MRGKQLEERGKDCFYGDFGEGRGCWDRIFIGKKRELTEKSEGLSVISGQLKQEIGYLVYKLSFYCKYTRIAEIASLHLFFQTISLSLSQATLLLPFQSVNSMTSLPLAEPTSCGRLWTSKAQAGIGQFCYLLAIGVERLAPAVKSGEYFERRRLG